MATPTDTPRRALIIGAGPGGLTAAIALRRVGIEAAVFERAPALGTAGAGLGIQSNALRALMRLGIGERLQRIGTEIRHQEIRDSDGELLLHLPMGEVADAYGTPSISLARADVQLTLADALEDGVLRLGAHCTGIEQDAESVTARFADGSSERGTLLIGADGGRSIARAHIYGHDDQPRRYSGVTIWRSIVSVDPSILPQDTSRAYFGRGRTFVLFPVGGDRVYWGAGKLEPEGGTDAPERVHEILLENSREFPSVVRDIIEATSPNEILRTDVYDRDPERKWVMGRVALLGDAAHQTTPFVGQGAGISMEDSVVLGKELALTDGLRDEQMLRHALSCYERVRIPHTGKIVLTSRRRGRIFFLRNPQQIAVRNSVFRQLPAWVTRKILEQTLNYEI